VTDYVDTLIVGGGQAGLAVSYYLSQQGRPHVVLEGREQATPGAIIAGIHLCSTLRIGKRGCPAPNIGGTIPIASCPGKKS